MESLKRDVSLSIATLLMIFGLVIMYNSDDQKNDIKIIKVDEKTEIRIVEGTKYRCTIIDNK